MVGSAARKSAGRKRPSHGFDLANSPGHLLRRAQQFTVDLYTRGSGPDGLTPRQFAVLHTVQQNEGLSQTDLVRLTGIDRSTLADMISRMLKRDLLARKRTEADQRANAVRITATGRRALKAAMPHIARTDQGVLSALPASKRALFLQALTIISDAADALSEASETTSARAAPVRRRRKTKTKSAKRR